MDMVCHVAEGMDTATKLYGYFLHEQVKAITISIVNENLIPTHIPADFT